MTGTLMVGVSGVRGIVGTDLTADVVTRWAQAFGTWARQGTRDGGRGKGPSDRPTVRPSIVVGRDSRESGPMFAEAAGQGLVAAGCDVIDVGLVPTPTIQLAVEHHRAAGGIAITASHNPIEWNALKFIGPDGIFLDGVAGARVGQLAVKGGRGRSEAGTVTTDKTAIDRHLDAVLQLPALDVEGVRRCGFIVALDAVRGAAGPVLRALLDRLGCHVAGINLETDGQFPRAPEPVPENLSELGRLVRSVGAGLGLAVDPDGDRLAIVDEQGRAIGEDYTLAFAVRAVLGRATEGRKDGTTEGASGERSVLPSFRHSVVVCNLSTSLVVEDAAREWGAEVVRTPVGEVHVARKMIELESRIGGEGNGGVMYADLHAGRDALVAAALVLQLLARTGKPVSEIVASGPRYVIVKAKSERGSRNAEQGLAAVYAALRARFPEASADTQDGLRLAWPDRWLHVRPSNTEPIIRLIAEAPTRVAAEQLVEEGRRGCAAS